MKKQIINMLPETSVPKYKLEKKFTAENHENGTWRGELILRQVEKPAIYTLEELKKQYSDCSVELKDDTVIITKN